MYYNVRLFLSVYMTLYDDEYRVDQANNSLTYFIR